MRMKIDNLGNGTGNGNCNVGMGVKNSFLQTSTVVV